MIVEYDEWPEGTTCCKCGCTDEVIDFVPTIDGEWICFECLTWIESDDSDPNPNEANDE